MALRVDGLALDDVSMDNLQGFPVLGDETRPKFSVLRDPEAKSSAFP